MARKIKDSIPDLKVDGSANWITLAQEESKDHGFINKTSVLVIPGWGSVLRTQSIENIGSGGVVAASEALVPLSGVIYNKDGSYIVVVDEMEPVASCSTIKRTANKKKA
jgi:hypothetical protein